MWKDVLHGIRALRRNPAFTAAAVLSLALGIGANTAIFSLIDQVVLRSLPVAAPESLVLLHGSYSAPGHSSSSWNTNSASTFPYPFYRDLREHSTVFSGMIASAIAPVRLVWRGNAQAADAELVSGDFFTTLGVKAAHGRTLLPSDDGAPGAGAVGVLSHAFWETRLGGDPAVVNQKVAINGQPFVVAGVAESKFNSLVQGDSPDIFVPLAMQRAVAPSMTAMENGTFSWLTIFARLKPGTSLPKAQAATDVLFHSMMERDIASGAMPYDESNRKEMLGRKLELQPAARGIGELREQWEKPLTILLIMVALVLLIACANVAGLLVARATGRQREIAIRLAMGASRLTLMKQLMVEGLLLAGAGALAGIALAHWSTAALLRMLPSDAAGNWVTTDLDWRALAYTVAVSMISAVLFALLPAIQATRPNLSVALKERAGNIGSRGYSGGLRRVMVTLQVALSLVLVVGAGLFSASAANLINARRGFRTERLTMFPLDVTLIRQGPAESAAFYRDLLDHLSKLPGQSGVAASDGGPYANAGFGSGVWLEGNRSPDKPTGVSLESITPGYFRTLGVPLRAGREFSDRDTAGAPKAVVVNDEFVRQYSPDQSVMGRHLGVHGPKSPLDCEIVGVVADVRSNVRRPLRPTVYSPYAQREKPARMAVYLRTTGDDARLNAAIRQAVHEADAGLPAPEIKPIELRIRESLYTNRLVAELSAAFGVLAALLAAIGLYGVIAFAVARRTGEIGVRMALGALPANVLAMVLADAGIMVAAGMVLGLGAAFGLSRYVESQLFGIQPADFGIYAAATVMLAMVAALAAFVPAWRASRIDPITALRYE